AIRQATRNEGLRMATAAKIPLWQDAAVRELAQGTRSPLFILSPQGTRLDDVALDTCLLTVEGQIRMLESISDHVRKGNVDDTGSGAALIAASLLRSERPVIVSGISSDSEPQVRATADLARALRDARAGTEQAAEVGLCYAMPEANTLGLALLMEHGGGTLGDALKCLMSGGCDAAVVLENNLFLRAPAEGVEAALTATSELVALDVLTNACNERAHLRLPVASFAEQNATWINYEGRAQSAWQVFLPASELKPAGEWLLPADPLCPRAFDGEQLLLDCADQLADFAGLRKLHALSNRLYDTMKAPRQLHRYSGRTALHAHINVHEGKQPPDPRTPFAVSTAGIPPAKDATFLSAAWAPGWNSNQAISKFQDEINGELRQGCEGVHLLQRTGNIGPAGNVDSESELRQRDPAERTEERTKERTEERTEGELRV